MTAPFNGLTPAEAERLAMLAEEAGEIVQAVGKVLRHGYDSMPPLGGCTNRAHLHREIIDVLAIATQMAARGDIRCILPSADRWEVKVQYTHHQDGDA